MAGEDESLASTFKDILLGVYNDLSMKVGQYRGENKPTLKKLHLIPLALLFCISTNIAKVKLFFDSFASQFLEVCLLVTIFLLACGWQVNHQLLTVSFTLSLSFIENVMFFNISLIP